MLHLPRLDGSQYIWWLWPAGRGYSVDSPIPRVNKIRCDREYKTIVVGIGNLGQAITNYLLLQNWI